MLMLYICCGFGSEDDASLNPQVEGNKLQSVSFLFKRGKDCDARDDAICSKASIKRQLFVFKLLFFGRRLLCHSLVRSELYAAMPIIYNDSFAIKGTGYALYQF